MSTSPCLTPFYKKRDIGGFATFPCGLCPACKKRSANGWAFRTKVEFMAADSATFATFTYDEQHLPLTDYNELPTLRYEDFKKFMKRLRWKHVGKSIRFLVTGEYGEHTLRPHYHAIILNSSPAAVYDSWGLGNVHCGTVTDDSIHYTLKYMMKRRFRPMHELDNRAPEFKECSMRMGSGYLTHENIAWHLADIPNRYYLPLPGGKRCAMPRYYRERIYKENDLVVLRSHILDHITTLNKMSTKQREDGINQTRIRLERTTLNAKL